MRKWTADVLRIMASALDPGPKTEGKPVATEPVPPQATAAAAGQRALPTSAVRVTSPSRLPGFATMVSGHKAGQAGRAQAGAWSAFRQQSPATSTAVGPLPRIEFPRPSEAGESAPGSVTSSGKGDAAPVQPGRRGPVVLHRWPEDPPKVRHP